MAKRRFKVTYLVEGVIDIDDAVIAAGLSTDFRKMFYTLDDEHEVVDHVAYNFIRNGVRDLQSLDGFADQPKDSVKLVSEDWENDTVVEELPVPKATRKRKPTREKGRTSRARKAGKSRRVRSK
jgi:hypothetical protein